MDAKEVFFVVGVGVVMLAVYPPIGMFLLACLIVANI